MGRLLILFIPLLALTFFAGFGVGRAGKKKAVAQATSSIRTILAAARALTLAEYEQTSDYLYRRQMLEVALDAHDENQRKALA